MDPDSINEGLETFDSTCFINFEDEIKKIEFIDWLYYIFTIGMDVLDDFYDERTNSFCKFDTTEFIANTTVDTL